MTRTRVLIVDDSAFARKVLRQVLSQSPNIEVVGTAYDGLDALERIVELEPDVITLDLVMPNLDGIGVLQGLKKLSTTPIPRVIVVSMSDLKTDLAISALREGAFEIVQKPPALANDRLYELTDELTRKIEAAAAARAPRLRSDAAGKRSSPQRKRTSKTCRPWFEPTYDLASRGLRAPGVSASCSADFR